MNRKIELLKMQEKRDNELTKQKLCSDEKLRDKHKREFADNTGAWLGHFLFKRMN